MAVVVQLGAFTATISDYVWTSESKSLEDMLNNMLDPRGPLGSDPNPDYTAAQDAINAFGGEIISVDKTDFDPKVKY